MTEMLLLYLLLQGQSTMYGLVKNLNKYFGAITQPGMGTVQPALKRLEKQGFIKSDKFFTDGGKPYFYYSITIDGQNALTTEILSAPSSNPIQLYPAIKLKLICSDILEPDERKVLYQTLKTELLKVKNQAEGTLEFELYGNNHSAKMVLNNVICEYKNTLDLIEGLKNAGNR